MAFRKLRIGEDIKILSIDKITYTNVEVVELEPLPKETKLNTTLADGYVRLFNGITQIEEIADTNIDDAKNVGKFFIGADSKIKILTAKAKYTDIEAAKKELNGYVVYYDIQDVEFVENMFMLDIVDKGTMERLFPSKFLSLEDISNFITSYCRNLSLERGNEVMFSITPSVKIKEIK